MGVDGRVAFVDFDDGGVIWMDVLRERCLLGGVVGPLASEEEEEVEGAVVEEMTVALPELDKTAVGSEIIEDWSILEPLPLTRITQMLVYPTKRDQSPSAPACPCSCSRARLALAL
jgi:hypothetical protein